VHRWLAALVVCLAVTVGVPWWWYASRPAANEGVPVAVVGAPVAAPSRATPGPGSPAGAGTPALPTPTAHAAAGGTASGRPPVRLRIPGLGVDAAVLPVGVDARGDMVVPREAQQVGWYRFGPAPGDPAGAVVVAGHVDTKQEGAGALFPLRAVRVGDRVGITVAGGRVVSYRVVGKQTIVKQRLPVERLFARDGVPRLVLITCGGPFLPEVSSYRDNLVVVAVPEAGTP